MKKLIIFDVDGTILDTIPTISYHVNRALEKFSFKALREDQYTYILGYGPRYLIDQALFLSTGKRQDESLIEEVLTYYDKSYGEDPIYLTKPYGGINELLLDLKERGYLLSLFSNKQDGVLKSIIKEIYGEDFFDFILGKRPDLKRKPNGEGLIYILDSLKVKREDAILIGDTEVDIKTGKNANVFTLACTWGFRTREDLEKEKADGIIDGVSEILEYI